MPSSGKYNKMLQDKVQHNLIKINKLASEGEQIRFIVPLFYNAIKYIFDNCTHCKIDPLLIEQVHYKFRLFHEQNQLQLSALDQVHGYMVEECFDMLHSKQIISKSDIKKSKFFSTKVIEHKEDILVEEETIFIPQETYHLEETFSESSQQSMKPSQIIPHSKLIRPISLDQVPNFQHSQQDVDMLWTSIQRLYEQHRLDEAYAQCEKFQNGLFLCNPNSKLTEYKHDLIQKIYQEENMMNHYYQFWNEPGYIFDKEDNGISMHYKINEENKEVSVKIQAELDISIQNFLCIVSQVDLFSEFVPFAYDTKQIKQIARNQKVGMTRVYVPIISNREAIFFASAYDRLKSHNSIFFYSKTISSDLDFQKKINVQVQRDSELVQLQYKFYILEYSPISHNRGKVRLATNIDMKLTFLPLFIINKTLRIFSFGFFKNLMEVNSKFEGSAWQQKMKQRPDLYTFFQQRIRSYLQNQQSV